MTRVFKHITMSTLVLTLSLSAAPTFASFTPDNPECIAPSRPGGGWDFICRATAVYLHRMRVINQKMKVTNMPGESGGIAFRLASSERKDDSNLLVAASNGTTSRLAQGIYANASADDVHFLATFGAEYGVVAVSQRSSYQSLSDLMAQVVKRPESVTWAGGSAKGGFDHIKPLMLAKAAGVKDINRLAYVGYSGGGEAVEGLLNGEADVISGDFSEIRGFADSGKIRVLAVLSPERLTGHKQYPTAREQGFNVIGPNWRGLYMPKGSSEESRKFWTDAVLAMTQNERFQQTLLKRGIEPFNQFGDEMTEFVKQNISDIRNISKEIGVLEE